MLYCGTRQVFSATQVLGMLLTNMRQIVDLQPAHKGMRAVEVVVSVPAYFTDAQRRGVRDAAAIGGLNCLRVLNDGTAVALSYGIFKGAKKEFPEDKELNVLFLDCGASQFTATAVAFTNTSLKVLATVSDSSFGGRDIDDEIAKEFSRVHAAKTADDTWSNKKARLKLLAMAEKAKITLSPHGVNEAPCNIECLMNDRDFAYKLTVERLEELVGARATGVVTSAIHRCLATAKLSSGKDFAFIELVGGSARPRIIKRAIANALGLPLDEANSHGLNMSMNLDEACARGCALACAQLSPIFKVKPFEVSEAVPAGIRVSWDSASGGAAEAGMDDEEEGGAAGGSGGSGGGGGGGGAAPNSVPLFAPGMRTLVTRQLKLLKSAPFELAAEYEAGGDSVLPEGAARHIARFHFDVPALENAPGVTTAPRVKVDFRLDMNCTLQCVGATLLRDAPPAAEPEQGMAAEGAAPATGEVGATAPATGDAAAAAAPPAKKKKMVLKAPVPFTVVASGMTSATVEAAVAVEKAMIARDAEIHATQDMRNAVEAFIYATRSALEDSLRPFCTPAEAEGLGAALTATEEWVTGDGFDSDKATFAAKLGELHAAAGPLSARKAEAEGRYGAVESLQAAIARFRGVAENKSGKHGHLADSDRDQLRAEVGGAERWLADMQGRQASLERYQDPVLTLASLKTQLDALERSLGPIERRPVPPPPAPAVEAPPAAPPAAAEPAPAAPAPDAAPASDMPA